MTTATSDGTETVRRLLDAFLAGDIDTVVSCVDDNAEFIFAEHHPFLGRYQGREQFVSDVVMKIAAELDGFRPEPDRILAYEHGAISLMRYRGTVRATGNRFDIQAVALWEVRDSKVVRLQEYIDTLAFRDAYTART